MKYIQHHLVNVLIVAFIVVTGTVSAQKGRQIISFNADWQFSNLEDFKTNQKGSPLDEHFNFDAWERVSTPHTAKIEPLVVVNPWIGESWYKKDFITSNAWRNKKVFLHFEAVMQVADVWLNGKHLVTHTGGYLPFTVDISNEISFDKANRIIVKTFNGDNGEIPPGKPIKELDFCYFSGIYRNVSLVVAAPLHITDAVQANATASGGVRIWYPTVSEDMAELAVNTHIRNDDKATKEFVVDYKLADKDGYIVNSATSKKIILTPESEINVFQQMEVTDPDLWHPDHPTLYTLSVSIKEGGTIVDALSTRTGIRKFEIVDSKLMINGTPFLLVGTNRHQEYPYIGNALSDNAQYRDAVKIKEAGFNIVRLSHYPQANAFMDACDELGLLTIAAIPGWQFVGNDKFMEHSYRDARELIRRDRNHASVVMWELSLNESGMPDHFMKRMNEIAREESPESKLITCGWIDRFYDVYIPALQHAKFPDYWKKYTGKMPLFTGEYGDWEYFAQDAGLNQAGYAGLKSDERTSRQLRGDGEKRLLQQATNFQEAHNDNLRQPHLGDANWLMFDYNRGYSPDIESSGVMDIFRLPKWSYYFYRSQQLPTTKIASYWNEITDASRLTVYSDDDEVALYLNNKMIELKKVERTPVSDQLPHPPFVFDLKTFRPGTLRAVGLKGGIIQSVDQVTTARKAHQLKLSIDFSGKQLKADGADVVFVYATVCDANGNAVADADVPVHFTVKGAARLIGQNPMKAEAGIATILLQASRKASKITIEARADGLKREKMTIVSGE